MSKKKKILLIVLAVVRWLAAYAGAFCLTA